MTDKTPGQVLRDALPGYIRHRREDYEAAAQAVLDHAYHATNEAERGDDESR